MLPEHWEKLTLLQSKKEQIQEFVKKYQGTYLWLSYEGKDRLVRFVGQDGTRLFMEDAETGSTYTLVHESDAIITAKFPKPGLINSDRGFLYFTRVPARQYRKAPCGDNCQFVVPFPLYQAKCAVDGRGLREAFFPKYTPLDIALKDTKKIGHAISKDFAVSLSPASETDRLLWFRMWPIAVIQDKTVLMKAHQLEQEVRDFIKRDKLELTIGKSNLS